jgi:hypothetical protein
MSTIIQGKEKLKEVITIDMAQERLCQLNNFGWSIAKYLHTPQRVLKEETWVSFMEFFWELPHNVQVIIIKKLQGNTKTWCIQHKSLIINASELTKNTRWLPNLICLLILLRIENIYTTYHIIKLLDHKKFDKVNINTLIEKWIPCDALWVPRRTRGNEK